MEFTDEKIETYALAHSQPELAILKKINRDTHANVLMPRMLSGHMQGNVLIMISKMIQPTQILEIGTYTGYSAICLAQGLTENGKIHTIDINEELEDRVRTNFSKSPLNTKITYIIGDAQQSLKSLSSETFDLVFIDADKKNNGTYYDLVFDQVRPGGLIIVDNVLWSGKILSNAQDKDTKNIVTFNDQIAADKRVEKLILTVRDGLFIIRKK